MKSHLFSLFVILTVLLGGCTTQNDENEKILAKINEYRLPLAEFQERLAAELRLRDDFKLTDEAKRQFLDESINTELLIQEAKRRELDRKKEFVAAINRYWESTLLRDLLAAKSREIAGRITVTEEETVKYYEDLKAAGEELPPLAEVEAEIKNLVRQEKESRAMEEWIAGLREEADISIDYDLLSR